VRVAITVEQLWHRVPGGIATSTVELVTALAARPDLELVGIAASHRRPPRPEWSLPIDVRHVPLPRRALYDMWQWMRWPPVESASGAVDVFHDAGYVAPPSRAPLVATIHDLLFLTHPDHYTFHSGLLLRRGLELIRRHARRIICPSRKTMFDCEEAGIEAERLRLVPWGVRTREVGAEEIERIRRRYRLHRPYVLFCGTVEPRKNLHRVLAAFRALDRPDVELLIAGPDGWKEDIDGAMTALEGRARRLGLVPRADLDALYSEAAVVAYPSLGEGFGLPVLEAMAYGAPVVTSAGSAMEEVTGGAALLVDPVDVDQITIALGRLIEDGDLARRLSTAARDRAATYTWERSAEMAAAVYAEAAGHAR
jgi:glycosyltransferase involved in cell wall biosynthesis